MTILFPLLASAFLKGDLPQSPSQASLEAASAILKVVAKAPPRRGPDAPVWRQSQDSWAMVWGHGAFGIGKTVEDPAVYRFRVPPDADQKSVGGKPPILVESYCNGLPLLGLRDGELGPARPLGFRYGKDGLCTNVAVSVREKGAWRRLRLSRRETTGFGRVMAANEYSAHGGDPLRDTARFGEPWIRISTEGYGDYWIDRSLVCVGPFGSGGQIISTVKETLEDMVSGR